MEVGATQKSYLEEGEAYGGKLKRENRGRPIVQIGQCNFHVAAHISLDLPSPLSPSLLSSLLLST